MQFRGIAGHKDWKAGIDWLEGRGRVELDVQAKVWNADKRGVGSLEARGIE